MNLELRQLYCGLSVAVAMVMLSQPCSGQILLPTTPAPAPPPQHDQSLEDDADRLRQRRERRERKKRPPPAVVRRKKLLKEGLQERPRKLFFESSLLATAAQTNSPIDGYTNELTAHFNIFYRIDKGKPEARGLWTGLRVAPFIGRGIYDGIPIDFGYTYFGPMIATGQFDPVPTDSGRQQRLVDRLRSLTVGGWMVAGGVAAVSRIIEREPDTRDNDDPALASKAIDFDTPGIWAEGRYLRLFFGALSISANAGVQLGQNHRFVYFGLGFGGIH